MEFSNFNKIIQGNKTTFKNTIPLERITQLLYFKDNANGNFYKKDFRWSFNKDYWSPWVELNQTNFTSININNPYLYLEIRYFSSGNGKVDRFTIGYDGMKQSNSEPSNNEDVKPLPPQDNRPPNVIEAVPYYEECPVEENVLIDANTLCGQDCDYYLWRPNHKGQQSMDTIKDLKEVLNSLSESIQQVDLQGASNISEQGIGVYYNTIDKIMYFKTLIQGTKVKISEDGNGKITISMDDSSINDLYNKIGDLIGINIGNGTGQIYKRKDSNDNLELRTLKAGDNNIIIRTEQNEIVFTLDASKLENPLWKDLVPVSATVGGINAGDIVDFDSNSIEILEKILYDYQPPTLNYQVNPEPGIYEKFENFGEITINGNFNNNPFKKVRISKVKVYNSLGYDVGEQTYPDVSSGTFYFVDPNYNNQFEDIKYTIELENVVDNQYMDPLKKYFEYKFINPFYYGIVDDSVTIDNIYYTDIVSLTKLLVPKQSNTIDYDVTVNYKPIKFVYAYDETYENLNTIWDVKNNFNVTNSFDTKVIPIKLDSGEVVNYRVYLKNHWISFTPEVNVFKLKFNFE